MVSFRTSLASSLALLLAVAAPSAFAGDGRFADGPKLPGSTLQAVAVADFNGDGRVDLAAPSYGESLIHLHLAKPGGGFERAPDVSSGVGPVGIVAADFNRDGNEDLAATSPNSKKVTVRLGKAGGGFTDAPDITFTNGPNAIAVGDFNRDGIDDLAVGDYAPTGGQVHIELGAGDGKFSEVGTPTDLRASALAVGDFNNDGNEDIAFSRFGSDPAGSMRGVGSGHFEAPVSFSLPGNARGVAVADFNNDGNEDLAYTIRDKALVSILFDAVPGTAPRNVAVGKDPYALAAGDFNADGFSDLAATNLTDTTVSVLVNRHDENSTFARTTLSTGGNPVDIAVANVAGDANDDLAITSATADGGIEIKRGLGTPPLAGNLLKNGGFEGPGAANVTDAAPPIPGWQRTGGMTFARYGLSSQAYFPTWVKAPRIGAAGSSLLWGGYGGATNGVTTASQTVDVAGRAGHIDAGHARARFSAYLGGALGFDDAMTARAEFLGKGGATLRTLKLGPVTPAARSSLTTLLPRTGATQLPRGTRRIRVRLTSVDADKSYSSAFADNAKLTLDARAAFRRDALIAFKGTTNLFADRPARVIVTNGNPFKVVGELRARTVKRLGPGNKQIALGKTSISIPPGGSRTAKFELPPAAVAELKKAHYLALSVVATVRDAAGHVRTVGGVVHVREAA